MNRNKQAGTRWESAIVAYLIDRGWIHTERRTLNGAIDKGDISGIPGVMVEAVDPYENEEVLDDVELER